MINCHDLIPLTSWPCRHAIGVDGEPGLVLAPPVAFWDGSLIPVYILPRGEHVEITDDGGVMEHLDVSGFNISSDGRRKRGLMSFTSRWGVTFDVELQMLCKPTELAMNLQKYLGALFSIAQWEYENSGKVADSGLLIAEVEMYLQAINPEATVEHDVELLGISGRRQQFPLRLGGTYYDAVATHHASTAALIKKLVDVRHVRETKDAPITIVVDDRANAERAKADIQIFTQLAHVNRLSNLQAQAMKILMVQ